MNGTRLLDTIHSPADVKRLDFGQLQELCAEIRAFLIDSVSKTGGHLSSNLGTIELTVALHKVFALRLLTIHNLHFLLDFTKQIRSAIASDTFPELRERFLENYRG